MDPNELVTLRNKKTGDVKKIARSQLPSMGLPIDYISKIDSQIKLGQTGNLNITDIAKTDPQAALIMQQAGVKPAIDPVDAKAAEDAKLTKQQALGIVDDLLNRDTGAITGAKNPLKYLTGEAQYTKSLTDQLKSLLSLEARKKLKGQGQISDKETEMLAQSVAALGTNKKGSYILSNEDFKKELLRIKQGLGGQVAKSPDVTTKPYSVGGFLQNAGQDATSIVSGLANLPSTLAQTSREYGQSILKNPTSAFTEDPLLTLLKTPTVKNMGKGILDEYLGLLSNPITTAYNKPVSTALDLLPFLKGGQLLTKGSKAGKAAELAKAGEAGKVAEMGKAGEIASVAKQSKIITGVEKFKSLLPQNIFAGKQRVAAEATVGKVKVNPQSIIDAGKKFAETDIDAAKRLPIEEPAIKNIKDIPTLLDRMQVWGSKTYGAKGIKATAKADLYNKFYQQGIEILKKEAPEVYKNRQFLRYTFELPGAIGKALWRATLGKYIIGG